MYTILTYIKYYGDYYMNKYFELNKRLSKLESILDSKSKSKSIVNEIISQKSYNVTDIKRLVKEIDSKLDSVLTGRFTQLLEFSDKDIDLKIVDKNNDDTNKLIGKIVFNFDLDHNNKDDTFLLLTGGKVNTSKKINKNDLEIKVVDLYKKEVEKLQNTDNQK